jgi:hypothetical protein
MEIGGNKYGSQPLCHHCGKIPEKIRLKGEKSHLVSLHQRFQSMVARSRGLGSGGLSWWKHVAEEIWSPPGIWEKERRGSLLHITLKGSPPRPVADFLLPSL